jgi:hypothetical protein
MKEAPDSSETSVLTRATQRNNPEDTILLSTYRLDLVGVQEVRYEGSGTESAGEYTFFYGKGNKNHELGTGFFVHKGIICSVLCTILFFRLSLVVNEYV